MRTIPAFGRYSGVHVQRQQAEFDAYDGEYMYVHTNYAASLYYKEIDGGRIFATMPLDGEYWQPVPFTRLLAYKDGKLVFEGTNHGNEYVDREENLKYLYQIFSSL